MPQETELKLSLRAQDVRRLMAHPLLRQQPRQRQRLLNTYFDTPQLDLMEQRVAVRERRIGRRTLLTVKTAGSTQGGLSHRAEWEGPTRPGALDFVALMGDAPLAQTLAGLAPQLTPIFQTDFVRQTWLIAHAGAHIEVALDRGHITAGHTIGPPTGARQQGLLELELELKAGPEAALLDLAHQLALGPRGEAGRGLWLYPSARSKAERGLALCLGQYPQPAKAEVVRLGAKQHRVAAFRRAALACLTHWQANIAPWLESAEEPIADPEFLHQARVALRRLRTSLRLFAPVLPSGFATHWNQRWRLTAHAIGEARNWDVLATEGWTAWLGSRADESSLQPLRNWLQTQRQLANQRARTCLQMPNHAVDLIAFTQAVQALPTPARPRRSKSLAQWALKRLQGQHHRLLGQTRQALREGPEGRHALRIALKKLRYAQEFLEPLLPAGSPRDSRRLVKAQTLLGELNDLGTAQTLLADCPLACAGSVSALIDEHLSVKLQALPKLERALLRMRPPGT